MRTLLAVMVAWFVLGALAGGSIPVQAASEAGKSLYEAKCALCHGSNGKGDGPAAATLSPGPTDFTNPAFWQGDVNRKISDTIESGKGAMPALDLSKSEIQAVIDYMSHRFK